MGDGGSCFRSYLNQWLSRDPFPGYGNLPQTQNGYSYVGNNPVNKVDYTGKVEQWWEDMIRDPSWKQVFLDSASRHNNPELTGLDDTGFAAVLASVVLIESKDIGGDNPSWYKRTLGNIVNPMHENRRIPIIMAIKQLEILSNRLFGTDHSEGICNIDQDIVLDIGENRTFNKKINAL
ncbi:MAG: hypothetical protein M5U34_26930 [Chloroflexi bacterium]|nr:hypothetical protein [Chloroflexota bacterium]